MAWIQKRTQAIKESWERVLLEELFVFSGGFEGAWLTVAGWIPTEDTRQQNNDRAGVLCEGGRVSLFTGLTDQDAKSCNLHILCKRKNLAG